MVVPFAPLFQHRRGMVKDLVDDPFGHQVQQFPVLGTEAIDVLPDLLGADCLERLPELLDRRSNLEGIMPPKKAG